MQETKFATGSINNTVTYFTIYTPDKVKHTGDTKLDIATLMLRRNYLERLRRKLMLLVIRIGLVVMNILNKLLL